MNRKARREWQRKTNKKVRKARARQQADKPNTAELERYARLAHDCLHKNQVDEAHELLHKSVGLDNDGEHDPATTKERLAEVGLDAAGIKSASQDDALQVFEAAFIALCEATGIAPAWLYLKPDPEGGHRIVIGGQQETCRYLDEAITVYQEVRKHQEADKQGKLLVPDGKKPRLVDGTGRPLKGS